MVVGIYPEICPFSPRIREPLVESTRARQHVIVVFKILRFDLVESTRGVSIALILGIGGLDTLK